MTDKDLTQSRRKLLLVAATAFVPMMIAYGLFFFAPDMIPKTTTNRGELVQPSIDISDRLATEGRWQLLDANDGALFNSLCRNPAGRFTSDASNQYRPR